MGMQTTRPGGVVRKADATIAKIYLTEPELQVLHRIVNLYIEFAELQALERKPMTMRDWVDKLDEFLKASGRKLLDHAGTISAEVAKAKAEREYERYQALQDAKPRMHDRRRIRGDGEAAQEACSNTREEAARGVMNGLIDRVKRAASLTLQLRTSARRRQRSPAGPGRRRRTPLERLWRASCRRCPHPGRAYRRHTGDTMGDHPGPGNASQSSSIHPD